MGDQRHKNSIWLVGEKPFPDGAQLAVLMDLRDELQAIKGILANLPTCDQLGNHCDRAVRRLRAPKRKAKK